MKTELEKLQHEISWVLSRLDGFETIDIIPDIDLERLLQAIDEAKKAVKNQVDENIYRTLKSQEIN